MRLGPGAIVESIEFGQQLKLGKALVSFHPSGHILGAAQIRVELEGKVVVVSGDYKLDPDPTCLPFEPVICDAFVTESTFGLPLYKWPTGTEVFDNLNRWWNANRELGRASLVSAYALGKAQRVLAGVDPEIGPIVVHGAVARFLDIYKESGVALPSTFHADDLPKQSGPPLVVLPPSALNSSWIKRFGKDPATSFASGWMVVRGARRRRNVERGFVLSDHADWPGLLQAIKASEAREVWVTHGFTNALSRYLRELGYEAHELASVHSQDVMEGD